MKIRFFCIKIISVKSLSRSRTTTTSFMNMQFQSSVPVRIRSPASYQSGNRFRSNRTKTPETTCRAAPFRTASDCMTSATGSTLCSLAQVSAATSCSKSVIRSTSASTSLLRDYPDPRRSPSSHFTVKTPTTFTENANRLPSNRKSRTR